MFKTIKCPCGEEFVKSYAVQRFLKDQRFFYYQWTCDMCGQIFNERAPEAIDITPKTQQYGI